MKNQAYKLLIHTDRNTFDELVTSYLNAGYELCGSHVLTFTPGGSVYMSQAVIKTNKKES
jgi:hypothetical protein